MDIIDECTNISCGYFNEHTVSEKQDIEFLELLSIACTKIDWETLPIERSCDNISYKGKKSTYNSYNYGNYGNYGSFYDGDYYNNSVNSTIIPSKDKKIKNDDLVNGINDFDFDEWYNKQREKIKV